MNRLGILAGGGELPLIGMKGALENGENPIVLSIIESDFNSNLWKENSIPVHIGKIKNLLKICKKNNVNRLLILGKVKKDLIFKNLKFDLLALQILNKIRNKNDYTIFEGVADEFTKKGIEIISQKKYLESLFLKPGRYTKKKLTSKEIADVRFGMEYAKNIANLDIGQTVIVGNQVILAVEAVEGTDEAIKRAGSFLKNNSFATVCKSSKKSQDPRFDLPTLGIQTLETMKKNKCKTLAFDSNFAIIIHPKEFIQFAEKSDLNIISLNDLNQIEKINDRKKII